MGSVLMLVAPDGSTPYIQHDELGEVSAMFWYVTEADYQDVGASAPGWYLQDDGGFEYPMNDYVIPYGTGFLIDCSDDAAQIVYSGEVLKGAQSIALASGEYNMTGNATPQEQKMGDFVLNNAASMGSVVMLVAADGSTPYIEHPELGEVSAMFWYVTEADYQDVGASVPGWYLQDDGGFEYPMNDYPIPAGMGFLIDCSDDDAQLVMPSVLAK